MVGSFNEKASIEQKSRLVTGATADDLVASARADRVKFGVGSIETDRMAFPRKPWTAADDAELSRLAENGHNRIEIARKLNRSVGATEVRASKLGVRLPTASSFALDDRG
ncbi:MAG: hypothetical protein JO314_13760 [Acidobacteria bacterium]|nr:hypothetical protein [Acidobacteriota bacterium]